MAKILFLFAGLMLFSNVGFAKECSYEQVQNGCKTVKWWHCYPKTGDCTLATYCSCARAESSYDFTTDETDTEVNTVSEYQAPLSSSAVDGVRCRTNPKTGTQTCCSYKNGVVQQCWVEL